MSEKEIVDVSHTALPNRVVSFEFHSPGAAESFAEAVSDWLCERVPAPEDLKEQANRELGQAMKDTPNPTCPRYWLYEDASASVGPYAEREADSATAEPLPALEVAGWAQWALDSLAIALGRLEALGEDYDPEYEGKDRRARNVVAAFRDRLES